MMKKQLIYLLTAVLMSCFTSTAWAWSGSGTADDPYLITNTADWNTLASNSSSNNYSGTYFKLTDDITVSEMVGTDGSRFAGIFDGNGHTLTFNQGTAGSRFSEQHCGPFRYISGATIKCLHIAGTIYTSNQHAGVVGRTGGTNHFIACRSSLTIDCSKSGDGTNGGFIGVVEGERTYFTNCLFDGQLLGSSSDSNGGFCGWSQNGVTLTNCLFAPSSVTFSATSSKTFSRGNNVSDSNCYYKQQYGEAQGTNAGSMSNEALQEALGIGWEISGGKVVPIISLRALTGEGTQASPYLIGSATDWDNLAVNVALEETYSGKFFKLTNNITVSEMVGTDQNNHFAGTFDGDGYTLTFNKGTADSRFAENFCAPFRYTRGASLKNLIIEGTIYTSAQFAAVLGNAHGDTYIDRCRSSIVINSSISGDGTHGGFIGVTDDGHNHFTGCVFNGKMVGSNTNSCGGFVGWTDAIYGPSSSDFTNCLFAPAELTIGSSGSATFSRGYGNNTDNITLTNCYYASSFGTVQGEQVYSVVGVSGMTVAMAGTPTATYNVSGLTFYGADKGFIFDGTIYGGNGDALSLNLSGSSGYTPSAGTLAGADPYTLTMAAANTIIRAVATYTAPTANPNTVKYDGDSKQVFWNAGSTSDGTMYYQVTTTNTQPGKSDGTWTSTWNSSITHRINAGTYYLWYYVKGDENHLDTEVLGPVTKELQKGTRTYTKPKANGSSHKSWTGSPQTLFDAGSNTATATLMYLVTESNTQPSKSDAGWATTIPQKTDIGTYYLWYYLDGGDNYEDTDVNTDIINRNIVKAYPSVTAPVAKTIPYDGESHELITAGTTSLFTMEYKVGDGDWSSSIPSAIAIGDYTVSYRVVPDDPEHYNTYGPYNVYAHIKAPVASITTSADVTTLYTEFNDALISAWVDGSTLKLLKAAETGSWYTLNNKGNITLDLNGFGIKSTSSQYQYATFNLSGTTNVTIIDSNPTATHKFEKDGGDNYATLNEASGNITINGGYITGAPRSAFNVGSGATLTMNAGTLIGNHSYYTGAAVNVSGTFTMTGGAICYNYSDESGTGVYVESDATFKLYGGSITYNLTNGGQGAGVGTSSAANFYMHGQPEVRYNQTAYGEASNVYLHYDEYGERSNDVVIQIDGTLNQSEKYRVGIQSGFHANSGSFVFTSGLATNSGGAYDFHQFFSNDQGYYPIRQSYYDSNEAELYKGSTTLETPTTPTVNGPYTYDGSSHAMLSAPSVSNGGVIKYQYQSRKKNKSETWESWSDWSTWYTYDALPVITDAGEYRVRAKAFADGMPGFNDSGTSSYATFTIYKGQAELLTAPTAKTGLVFTGSPMDLVNAGTSDHGTVVYSLTGPVNYHQEIPQGTLAGTYHVYYGVEGDYNYRGNFGVEYVNVTIYPLSVSENDYEIADFFDDWIGQTVPLRIERTLLKNGYFNTLCLPFDLSASEIAASNLAGCELFVFSEAEMETNEETGEPQLRQVITPATSISAGVPYLIRWKNSGPTITELVFSEVTIQNAMGDGVDPSAIPTEGVQFLGFVPRTQIEAGNHNYLFLGQNNTLYWPANDDPGTMKGFRAYFYIPTGTTINNAPVYHGMPARLVIRENAPTGVEYVSQEPMANSQKLIKDGILYIICGDRIYNAQGQVIK